jgi:putative DNA methylase
MINKKKLIEVALPLEAINIASAREKSIRHGHPSTLHLWWARRPLAAARAVIFAQMVDDPSAHPDIFRSEKAQEKERQRLFRIIEELVKWENTDNEVVLQKARDEIWQSWRHSCAENADNPRARELFVRYHLPAFHDPFAGGGALPLEAQRLGLVACGTDLNPVAVLINKAMIEIPPKFSGQAPRNPFWQQKQDGEKSITQWRAAYGLADDVRYYGRWMRNEAFTRIGNLYPDVEVTPTMTVDRPDLARYVGHRLVVIAWLWARTVRSPNPAFATVEVPLASTFLLAKKVSTTTYIEPVVDGQNYRFAVRVGQPKDVESAKNGTKLSRGANFRCILSGVPMAPEYVRDEGAAGRMGARMMAVIVEGINERVYLPPSPEMEALAQQARPNWEPEGSFVEDARAFTPFIYGLKEWRQLFTSRQLVALTTFADLVGEAREQVKRDTLLAYPGSDTAADEYANAVSVYLAFGVDKLADRHSTLTRWDPTPTASGIINTFSRQALAMSWDYSEGNPFSEASGNFDSGLGWIAKVIERALPATAEGTAYAMDASTQTTSKDKVISTDPPYYDNVPYADLSDFFYVWLRRSLKSAYPSLFETLAVPKAEELTAFSYRHNGRSGAEAFFLEGMTEAMHRLAEQAHPAFPITIYYAFKQSESDGNDGISSTGWETFLEAVIRAGLATTGTWPMRTELANRMRGIGSNALASSVVLVCRSRDLDSKAASRREFVAALKTELPLALAHLQAGNIAPVDLAQAAIGPGMAVFTRYSKVLNAEGEPLSVRSALALINQTLDDALAEQEGDFDPDTRWALTWFEQTGFAEGDYGLAEQLSKSKNTAVDGLVDAGILISRGGKVRLLKPSELPSDWDPTIESRLTVWEMVHQLIRVLESGGEQAASVLLTKLGTKAETARELCYRLFTLCERKKRAADATAYNGLVQSWPEITRLAGQAAASMHTPNTNDMFAKD